MRHESVTDEIRDQAALHVLGLLPPDEAGLFSCHIQTCSVCAAEVRAFEETAAVLPLAQPASAPHPSLRDRVLQSAAGDLVVRAGEGVWTPTGFAGVEVRPLRADPERNEITMLVRMASGAAYPRHHHAGPEQCYVLEGELRIGDLVLRAGDYTCAGAGTLHPEVSSPPGCLLLIIASREDVVVS